MPEDMLTKSHVLPLFDERLKKVHIALGRDLRGGHVGVPLHHGVKALAVKGLYIIAGMFNAVHIVGKGDDLQIPLLHYSFGDIRGRIGYDHK